MSSSQFQHKYSLRLPKQIFHLAQIFDDAGYELRVVGGSIRDLLIDKQPTDFDLASALTPEKVIKLLKLYNIKTIPTGLKYGTVTALIDDVAYEITTLRSDITTDGRHATVEFCDNFKIDAERRDFTINAMSYCPLSNQLYDYFDGISDLKSKQVRFIGDASKRINEDYLRILRFFRFSVYYAKELNENALQACASFAEKLQNISYERIKYEIDRIISAPEAMNILKIMHGCHILSHCLPKPYEFDILQLVIDSALKLQLPLTNLLKYAALLNNKAVPELEDSLKKHKFSNREIQWISHFAITIQESRIQKISVAKLWYEKPEMLSQYVIIALAMDQDTNIKKLKELYSQLSDSPPIFPVAATDLLALGFQGRTLGIALKKLQSKWIESNFTLTSNDLIEYATNLQNNA